MAFHIVEVVTENNVVCSNPKKWAIFLPALMTLVDGCCEGIAIFGQEAFAAIGKDIPVARKIILSKDREFRASDAEVVATPEEALALIDADATTWLIGTGLYSPQLYPQTERICILKCHSETDTHSHAMEILPADWIESARKLYWPGEQENEICTFIEYGKNNVPQDITVVLSTYNQPRWLEKVLWGYEFQNFRNFEIVLADDGSSRETWEMIERLRPQLSYPLKHVWHTDRGFRKCAILNKAIEACGTDYIVMSDGDCIPRNDFLAAHLKYRKPAHFLSGGYHKLNMDISHKIAVENIRKGNCFDIKWLKANGMRSTFKNNKLTSHGFKEWFLNTFTTTRATWNGHNASGWKKDILAVNGFDERMGYGGEDREMGERLVNNGIRPIQIRYSAITVHLDHKRGYIQQEVLIKNKAIRKETARQKSTWAMLGVTKSLL